MTKRIIATLVREAWVNHVMVDLDDGRSQHDVTDQVVALGESAALNLTDDSYETDSLVDHDHSGPFRVEVAQAIRDYYADDE